MISVAGFLLFSVTVVSAQLNRLKVVYPSTGLGNALLWVAKDGGVFAENNLDVQLIFIGSSTVAAQALLAGDVPIGTVSGATAINAALSGSDLVILGSTKKDPVQAYLMTAKDITDVAKLRGKKLGVSRLGASSDFVLRLILKKIGLEPDRDVSIVQVGSSAVRMAALANGVVDGTALSFEEMTVAKKLGFNLLLDISKLGIETLNNDIVTTRRFVRESRPVVQRFMRAIAKGVHFHATNKQFSMDVIAKYTRSGDREKIESGYDHNVQTLLRKPYPTIKGIQLALEELGQKNPQAKLAKPEQFIDISFVKELDESGWIDGLYKK